MRPRPAEMRKVLTFLPHLELKWKWNCFQDNVANFILISATHFVSAQCMHSAHISGICLIGNIPNYLLSLPAPFLAIWLIQMVAKAVPGGSQSIFGGMLFSPKCCRAGLSSWVLRPTTLPACVPGACTELGPESIYAPHFHQPKVLFHFPGGNKIPL